MVGNDDSVLGLASIRRNRGLTLEQIAQDTKISVRALQAIETGEFKKLPGGIYNTSYIRQYARAIEFDESELLAYYHSKVEIPTETSPVNPEKGLHLRDFRFLVQH
jgi:cytoskeletal protein RodZ